LQDRVLQETIQRERYKEFQQHTFLGRILASIFGMDTRQLARAEEALELAVFQTAYDPTQIRESMQRVQAAMRLEREEKLRDARIMSRVASYTEPDDEAGEFPTGGVTQTRFSGVKKPWTE
jgi:hypothetical protein